MAEPFVGQIMTWAIDYAPMGWASCDGSKLNPQQNAALFNVIGTTYGGDGKTYFNVPNLAGRVGVHQGQGQGLSPYTLGGVGGQAMVQLDYQEMAPHSHPVNCNDSISDQGSPAGNLWGPETTGQTATYTSKAPNMHMSTIFDAQSSVYGATAHSNSQPFLVLNFCIALMGILPQKPQSTPDGGAGSPTT